MGAVVSNSVVNTQHSALDSEPVTSLRGVGARNAERLHKLGIQTVQDLLFHLPLRYQDRTRIVRSAHCGRVTRRWSRAWSN